MIDSGRVSLTRLKQMWQRLTGSMMSNNSGDLFVVAAPSGAGKTSLVHAALARDDRLHMSVSYTTRPQREKEVHGKDYFFVSKAEFDEILARGELLEHAQVFDNYYGTGTRQIQARLDDGASVILEIDWQGAQQVRKSMPNSRSIFILPPSRQELERRLRGRRTDSEEVIARRLRDSVADMSHWQEFDFIVINENFDKAVNDLSEIFSGKTSAHSSGRSELVPLVKELLG